MEGVGVPGREAGIIRKARDGLGESRKRVAIGTLGEPFGRPCQNRGGAQHLPVKFQNPILYRARLV